MERPVSIATKGVVKGFQPSTHGAWAWVSSDGPQDSGVVSGRLVTSHQMEFWAVLHALHSNPQPYLIYSDNQYVVNALNRWVRKWLPRARRVVENGGRYDRPNWDLIAECYEMMEEDTRLVWVRGHNGHVLNEKASALATLTADRGEVLHGIEGE